MNISTGSLGLSSVVYMFLLFFLGVETSCKTESKSDRYQEAGTSKLTVTIDSLVADQATVDNALYMELRTKKDTFLIKPINQELSFPTLEDSLISVRVQYKSWYFQAQGALLHEEYPALYFPNQDATLIIDAYPFENPTAKKWLKEQKDRIYYEIRLQKQGRFYLTSMVQDDWRAE